MSYPLHTLGAANQSGENMKLLRCKNVKKGMRVILTNPAPRYVIGMSNPLVGTNWECEGTIISYSSSLISVMWDNGKHNEYSDNELSEIEICEGRCESIWESL